LLKLAEERFSGLTRAERVMLSFTDLSNSTGGDFAAVGTSDNLEDSDNDPSHAEKWDSQRGIRPELIRWLCVNPQAKAKVEPRGIRVLGGRFAGRLDLAHVSVPFSIVLRNCSILGGISFANATFSSIDLSGSYTGDIDAEGVVIHGHLVMKDLRASGEVWLPNSTIDGNVVAPGAHFTHSNSELDLNEWPSGSAFNTALDLISSRVRGDIVLCCGLVADGAVMLGAMTMNTASFSGGFFNNPNNTAIEMGDSEVRSSIYLGTFPYVGSKLPTGVHIDGLTEMDHLRVGGSLMVIEATFSGRRSELHGFQAQDLTASSLIWQKVTLENEASVEISGTVGALTDDAQSWPAPGKLKLDGFTYGLLQGGSLNADSRLQWLYLQPYFRLQPYRQLAKVLRANGDDEGANRVLVVAEDRRYAAGGRLKAWLGTFLNVTVGYGHRPLRTIGWSLVVVVIGWAIVWVAKKAAVMRQTWPENTPLREELRYQSLHPLLYSLDVFLPFVNLHQEHYWWPDADASGDWVLLNHRFVVRGSIVQYYLWLQIISGWLLSAILVAGVTGLLRND
jgi:hypothetical protein